MKSICRTCKCPAHGEFRAGQHRFVCSNGHRWSIQAKYHGQPENHLNGTKVGAAVGLVGAIGTLVNPLGGMFVGALLGSALNGDNGITCRYCSSKAFPTGRSGKQGDRQYQCSMESCRRFVYR